MLKDKVVEGLNYLSDTDVQINLGPKNWNISDENLNMIALKIEKSEIFEMWHLVVDAFGTCLRIIKVRCCLSCS